MNHDDYFFLGTIQRTYKLEGAVVAFFDVDDLSKYKKLDWIFIESGSTLTPHQIKKVKQHDKSFILELNDVTSVEQAETYVRKNLFLPLDKLPKLDGNHFYYHEIVGYTAIDDAEGVLGVIEELQEFPGQTLAKLKHKGKEVLLPLTLTWVKKVDRENKILTYSLPEGYLDVYISEQTS